MMRLIWIRHGETKGNQMKRYIGHLDEPLAETGKEQAFRLAEALSREKIDFVVTSDLKRAVQTARPFLQKHPGIPVAVMPALRECSFGIWEGKTYQEAEKLAKEAWWNWIRDPVRFAPQRGKPHGSAPPHAMFPSRIGTKPARGHRGRFYTWRPHPLVCCLSCVSVPGRLLEAVHRARRGMGCRKKEAEWIISRSLFQKGDF